MSSKGQGWGYIYELPLNRALLMASVKNLSTTDLVEVCQFLCRLNLLSFYSDIYAKKFVGRKFSDVREFKKEMDIERLILHFCTFPKAIDPDYPHISRADQYREKIVRKRINKLIKHDGRLNMGRGGQPVGLKDLDFDLTFDLLDGYAS